MSASSERVLITTTPAPFRQALASIAVYGFEQAEREAIWQLTLQRAAAEMGRSLSELGKTIERVAEALRDAGIVAETPPTEPRERALWARRNRGTGPATPAAWHQR